MANTCYDTNLLRHSGTSQAQRALQSLLSDSAKVDERTTAQLILFAKKYGAYLNNFNSKNEPEGDWQALMSNDVSVIIAGIADIKAKDFSLFLANVKDEIRNAATDEESKKHFKTVFDFIFSLASLLDNAVKQLPDSIRFTSFLSVAISSNLSLPLGLLNHYYKTFRDAPLSLIDENTHSANPLMPVTPVVFADEFGIGTLTKSWKINSFSAPAITLGGVNVQDDINHILTHNLFTAPLQKFINGVINIVSKASPYLEETLTNYPAHQPHYALYLAFLRLFRYAQDHLNQFTQNHLDFYYKDVLQLENRNAEPGFVHLLFELQKSADQYLLAKGTTFKAGKDENNNDLLYAITNDVVLQKASVQSLHSLYLNRDIGVLLASTVANSENGEGAKLLSGDQSWSAFRNAGKTTGATIGFAIASNLLFLNEGSRIITFTFQCDQVISLSKENLEDAFVIRFTGKKDWFDADDYKAIINGTAFTLTVAVSGDAPPVIPYSEKIHKDNFDAALPVAKLLLTDYQYYEAIKKLIVNSITIEVNAVVKDLSLQNKDGAISASKPFKPFGDFPDSGAPFIIGSEEIFQKPLTSLSIDIDWQDINEKLAEKASKNQLENAYYKVSKNQYAGTLAMNNKSYAVVGKAIPGDAEVKEKTMSAKSFFVSEKATDITPEMNLTAKAMAMQDIKATKLAGQSVYSREELSKVVYTKLTAPADLIALSGGQWKESIVIDKSTNIRLSPIILDETESKSIPLTAISFDGNKSYDIKSTSGFIQMRLNTKNYSLDTYLSNSQKAMTEAKVKVVMDKDGNVKNYSIPTPKLGKPAPQLVANGISLTYSAKATIDFTNDVSSFYYHIEPFGTRRIEASLITDDITLLPVFNLENNSKNGDGGELWIGIQNAFADETLSLLFQVSDGSSNPLKSMTEIKWYYLSDNHWKPIDKTGIGDETNNLTRSGIVTLTLPADITNNSTRADASLFWIKLVADHDTDAVNRLVTIRTNAAKAAFVQDLKKGIEYKTPATANVIGKPAAPIASIKKTEQPYPSFGGRLHESDDRFYIRVSERLRHKNRAVTVWDYERLVLDYFPQIHKAKCIPHTGFIISRNTNKTKYSEVLPGHVMLVMVPDIKNNLSSNVLRPYTSIGLIEEVQEYLDTLRSPFIKLHISNPQFEEVQFDFGVEFLPNHDFSFYQKQLNDDIEQFLTPWAFDKGKDIEFGGKIQKSVVLNFVEERPYVDFVTDFTMNHFIPNEDGTLTVLTNKEEAVASTARSILVSYSDEATGTRHLIQSPANCNNNG